MEKDNSENKLVVFGEYENSVDASIAKGVLETNGVHCVIENESFASLYPVGGCASFAAVRVMVRESDLELAHEIMASEPIDETPEE